MRNWRCLFTEPASCRGRRAEVAGLLDTATPGAPAERWAAIAAALGAFVHEAGDAEPLAKLCV